MNTKIATAFTALTLTLVSAGSAFADLPKDQIQGVIKQGLSQQHVAAALAGPTVVLPLTASDGLQASTSIVGYQSSTALSDGSTLIVSMDTEGHYENSFVTHPNETVAPAASSNGQDNDGTVRHNALTTF